MRIEVAQPFPPAPETGCANRDEGPPPGPGGAGRPTPPDEKLRTVTRDGPLDALKGIAIVGVLFIHTPRERFDSETRAVIEAGARALQWCVPAFFFAAGLLTYRDSRFAGCWGTIRRRAVRLLLPFVAFTLLYKCLLVVSVAVRQKGTWSWAGYGGAQLYFLPYLVAVTAAVALVLAAVGRRGARLGVLTGVAAFGTLLLCPTTPTHGPHPELAGLYTANYLAGAGWAVGLRAVPTVLLVGGALGASWWGGNWNLAAAAVPPLAYAALGGLAYSPATPALERLGRWSGAVYVWHTPFLLPLSAALAARALGGGIAGLVVALSAALGASILLGWTAEKWSALRPFRV